MIDLSPNHLKTVRQILAEHVPACEVRAFGFPRDMFLQRTIPTSTSQSSALRHWTGARLHG